MVRRLATGAKRVSLRACATRRPTSRPHNRKLRAQEIFEVIAWVRRQAKTENIRFVRKADKVWDMWKRWIALVLVFAAALPAARSVWLLCQDGMMHATCCCATAEQTVARTDSAPLPPKIGTASCCVLTEVAGQAVVSGLGLEGFHFSPPPPQAIPQVSAPSPVEKLLPPAPPRRSENARLASWGPPRFITHCSWLI